VEVVITESDNSIQTATTDSEGFYTAYVLHGNTTATINSTDPRIPPEAQLQLQIQTVF